LPILIVNAKGKQLKGVTLCRTSINRLKNKGVKMSDAVANGIKNGVSAVGGAGVGVAAVAVAGEVGLSAVGISTGLAALGVGSMALGIGTVALIGAGVFCGAKKLLDWVW